MNIKDALSKIEQAYSELEAENQRLQLRARLLGIVVVSTCPLAHDVPAETEGVIIRYSSSHFLQNEKWLPGIGVRFDSATHDTHWFTVGILDDLPSKETGVPKIMDTHSYRQNKDKIKKIYAHFKAEQRKLAAWQGPNIATEAEAN